MDKINFKNYSINCVGTNTGLPELIIGISEGKPVILDGDQLMMISFTSVLNLDEIENLLVDNGISGTLFEMNPDTSRGFLNNPPMQKRLFDDFFYKKIKLEDIDGLKTKFSSDTNEEYVEFEDIDTSDLHSEIYLHDLLGTLKEALAEEEYEYASELRDEINEIDPDFYEKNINNDDDSQE